MSKFRKRYFKLILGYILLALGVSPLTQLIVPSVGNLIEPFILAGIWLIDKYNPYKIPFLRVFKSRWSINALLFLLAMALIGLFTPTGKITMGNFHTNIYADFRSCYIFIYACLLMLHRGWTSEQKIQFLKRLLWIVILFGFVYSFNKISINVEAKERTLGVPTHFLVIQSFLYYRNRNYIAQLLLLSLGAYYAIYTFARINIFFFAAQIAMVVNPLLAFKSNTFKQSVLKVTALCALTYSLYIIIPAAYEYYMSSEGGKAQINRIVEAINNTGESEGERTKSLYVPFTDADFFLWPEGLGWRNHVSKICNHFNNKILSTQDSAWLYLYYHFGLIGGMVCCIFLFRYLWKLVKSARNMTMMESMEKMFMLSAFLMGFFTQGVYFTVPQNALGGGYNVGNLIRIEFQSFTKSPKSTFPLGSYSRFAIKHPAL